MLRNREDLCSGLVMHARGIKAHTSRSSQRSQVGVQPSMSSFVPRVGLYALKMRSTVHNKARWTLATGSNQLDKE